MTDKLKGSTEWGNERMNVCVCVKQAWALSSIHHAGVSYTQILWKIKDIIAENQNLVI